MGLFDLPSPLLHEADLLLRFLPAALRLVIWAAVGAGLSMWLYKLLSAQEKLEQAEKDAKQARETLNAFDGDFDEAGPLIANALRTAGRRLWLPPPPAVIASLPLLALVVWLSNDYGYQYPETPAQTPVQTMPGGYDAALMPGKAPGDKTAGDKVLGSRAPQHVVVSVPKGRVVSDLPLNSPVPVIEKRRWWNWFFGNPAGYLPDAAPVERVEVKLPQQQVLSFGPPWARGWELTFFVLLFAFSLIIKKVGRIV